MVLMLATTGIGTPVTQFVWANLSNFIIINIMLAVFNMLPLPPFDGSHVMEGILPRPLARRYARLRPYGMALMLILFVALPLIAPNQNLVGKLIGPPVEGILALLSQILAYFAR
jgi:Zn-dependent protease